MKEFDYTIKRLFNKDVKIIKNCCNRTDMSCCGGGESCCKSLFLNVTNVCNANCYFCIADKGKREISNFEKLEHVITELVNNKVISKVVLTGGEPTLHSRFTYFLTLLDKFELMYYSLNTNGILLHKFKDEITNSKLKHINISMHHYDESINKRIMGNCLTFSQIEKLRKEFPNNIEFRLACTITKDLYTEEDILTYINKTKSIGIDNVIFRNEYKGFDKYLTEFKKIWGNLFSADICNCGYKLINGVNSEYRESNVRLKEDICQKDLYYRDFIYKDDDMLSGSWNYGSQLLY
jgi:MoaA/NifB/PqqE/SkfB family radical SAM enzyme